MNSSKTDFFPKQDSIFVHSKFQLRSTTGLSWKFFCFWRNFDVQVHISKCLSWMEMELWPSKWHISIAEKLIYLVQNNIDNPCWALISRAIELWPSKWHIWKAQTIAHFRSKHSSKIDHSFFHYLESKRYYFFITQFWIYELNDSVTWGAAMDL